jgi:hypothetical protein
MPNDPQQAPVEPNPADPSGNVNPDKGGNPNPTEPKDGFVKYESYQKLLDEKKKLQAKFDAIEREKSEIEAEKSRKIEEDLKAKDDWKKLVGLKEQTIEGLKKENDELKGQLAERDQRRTNGLKMRSFLDSLSGKLDEQYWPLVDLEKIVINPETGMPEPQSAQSLAKEFEAKYPLVIQRAGGPTLPNDAPKGAGAKLTYDEWLRLPPDQKKARLSEVMNSA